MISILYVDDEPELLSLGKLFLERDDEFSVVTAESVPVGLGILAGGTIDAVVSDYQMPEMDGIEFLKTVRADYPDLPFILFTGRGREEVVIEAINNGVDFYLQKGGDPIAQFAELRHKIKNAVERRYAIDALKDSEQRLSDLINFLPDATFAIDTEGRVIAWNKAIEDMTGVSAAEILGKGNHEYAIPFYGDRRPVLIDLILADPEKVRDLGYTISAKAGDLLMAETMSATPRGKPGAFLVKTSYLYNKHGAVAGAIESVRDITDTKNILSALKEREAQLKSIFRAAPAGIGVVQNGVVREVNEHLCTMTGYLRAELLGMDARAVYLTPEAYASVSQEKDLQIATRGMGSVESKWRKKDGIIIDILINFAPLIPGDPESGTTFAAIDITERKQADDELRAAYEKNRGLMDSANDVIFIADVESGVLLDANRKAQDLIGKTLEEIQTMHYMDLFDPDVHDENLKHFRQYSQGGDGICEASITGRDGRVIPGIVSTTHLELGGKSCLMGIFHDISAIRKVQDSLQLANKKLNLLAEITRHDIRNKLTVLSGYLELLQERPAEPQYTMYLSKLRDTVRTISTNIEFTRLYQNLGVVAPEWQNCHERFFSACTHLELKRTRIQSDCGGFEIFADPLLERVFYNIVENAVQYAGKITTIRITADEQPDDLVIRIQDDGIGIPLCDKEKIFSRGYGKNTGLGLFLCREILSITGITITETGRYQHGACFEIHVPHGTYRLSPVPAKDRCYILVND